MQIDVIANYPAELCFRIDCLPNSPEIAFVAEHDRNSWILGFDLHGQPVFGELLREAFPPGSRWIGGTSSGKKKADLTTPKDAA